MQMFAIDRAFCFWRNAGDIKYSNVFDIPH